MATITIKNIPDDLYEQLKASAAANRRSINNEVIVHIERAVRSKRVDVAAAIERARKIRESIEYVTNDEELAEWINEGRS